MEKMIVQERDLDLKHNVFIDNKKYLLSTVALCIEHSGGMLYESMVFAYDENGKIDLMGLYCERYKTKREAIDGHNELLFHLEAGVKIW
jgi:hypothetical protein